jgi:tape measure domain-containing protein
MATERVIIEVQARGVKKVRRGFRGMEKDANKANKTLALLRAGLVLFAGARIIGGFVEMADGLTNVQNRLRLVTTSVEQLTAVQRSLFAISQETRSEFEANATVLFRLTRSTQKLGLTFTELLNITRGLGQAVAISGAQSQEAKNAMIQFSQGLAAGALTGDELRSVVEQLPSLADAIGKEFGKAGGELIAFAKAAGNDRILRTDKVIRGIQKALPGLASQFSTLSITAGQAFLKFQNSLTLFIGGISQSVELGAKLDVVLQAIARNLPEITAALLALVGIGAFNLLVGQVLMLHRTLLALAGFLISPFVQMATAIIVGPIRALAFLSRTLLAVGAVVKSVVTGAAFVKMATAIVKSTVALRAFLKVGILFKAFVKAQKLLIAGFIVMRSVMVGATLASKALLVSMLALRSFGLVLKSLTILSLRFVAVLFLNPVVLGFAAVIAGIVGTFLLFRKVISDFIPEGLNLGKVFDTFAAVVLTAIDTVTGAWRLFGPALKDILFSAINAILQKSADFFNFFITGINTITGSEIELVTAFKFDNDAAGKAAELADFITDTFNKRIAEGGNVQELKNKFTGLFDTLKGFLPQDLTAEMAKLLDTTALGSTKVGDSAEDIAKARKEYESLRESLDPLADGMKTFEEGQAAIALAVAKGNLDLGTASETTKLLARDIVGLGNAEFEFSQRQRLVNQLLAEGALSAEAAAEALRDLEIAAQGAFVGALNGTFPLLRANQDLNEITQFLEKNQDRLAANGLNVADVQQRMAREAFGLSKTYAQVNEEITALRQNQALLGLSTEELETEVRKLNIAFLETQRDAASGANRAFLKLIDDATNAAQFTEKVMTDAFKAIEDAVVDFATTGTFSVNDFFRNFAEQLLRLGTQQAIAGIGGAFTSALGGVGGFGGGGPAGGGFNIGGLVTGLLGFANGGNFTVGANTAVQSIPGIDNRLIAFRARDGEDVSITPRGGGGSTDAPVNQIFNIQAKDADSFRRSQSQLQNRALAGINQARRRR